MLVTLVCILTVVILLCACSNLSDEETLDSALEKEIIEDFLVSSALSHLISSDEVDYTYLGKYDNSYALYFYTSGAHNTPAEDQIGGLTFSYRDSRTIRIWNNGEIYRINEAYKKGLINWFNVFSIWKKSSSLEYKEPYLYFDNKIEPEIPYIFYENPEKIKLNILLVYLDKRISRVDVLPDKSFWGLDNIEEVRYLAGLNDKEKGDGNFEQCLLLLLSTNTPKDLEITYNHINSIDGVKVVNFEDTDILDGEANDNYYVDGLLWGLSNIEVQKVWDFTTGSSDIFIGVIDLGVKSHEDLVDNLVQGYDFVNGNEVTSDDPNNHGTYVAGIIGAVGDNIIGVTGVNWNISIVPLQVFDNWLTPSKYIESAIDYATASYEGNDRIKIINLSMGSDSYKYGIERSISEYPGLLICAAGNEGINTDEYKYYPGYHGADLPTNNNVLENIIVVGAINRYNSRGQIDLVFSSNYGENSVDIYAPGIDVYTTSDINQYSSVSGTSYATPYVTGVAALLLSIKPDLTTDQLKACILEGAQTISIMVGDNNNIVQNVKKLSAWGAFKYLMNNYYYHVAYNIDTTEVEFSDIITNTRSDSIFDENTSFTKLNIQECGDYTINISSTNSLKSVLYNSNFESVSEKEIITETNTNKEILYYLSEGTYYLKVNLNGETVNSVNISISIDYNDHIHEYTGWERYSNTYHIEVCECGERGTIKSVHVVEAPVGLEKYALCIDCGTLIDVSDNHFPSIMSITKYSVNGSYILPNGVIVLVEEDVEAYLNGTLVFYDRDKLPVTQ